MSQINVSLPGRDLSYHLVIEPGLRSRLGDLLSELGFPAKLFLVTDRRVGRLYAQQVQEALAADGFAATRLTIPGGERSKSWPVVQRLAKELLAHGAHRGTPLLALGGGVVGDLTGFLASIYMRGVPFVQVPTSLLAMVDAGIGGKTAIDLPEGKNLLGTFHQPRLVAIDPEFLRTLPLKERRNGLAEVIKAALIRDAGFLHQLIAAQPRLFKDEAELTAIIQRAAAIKAEVVAADEREADLRRILNFGHTLGHALEQASHFRLPHGEAVAWGMLAALRLSRELTGLPADEADRARRLILDCGLARRPLNLDPQEVLAALPRDKKRMDDNLVFILLRRLGEPVIQTGIPLPLIASALDELLAGSGS